jgi:Zn-dependent M28 family amino/carboxypeptidase
VRGLLDALAGRVSVERLRTDLEVLPAPRHRRSNASLMEAAESVVATRLTDAGWPADRRPFATGANIVARREGMEPAALAIVAHLDTVAGSGGADDNGSGVVALIEVARLLAPFRFRRSVVLAAVDLEETGQFAGSEALITDLLPGGEVAGAIVLECIGFTDRRASSQRVPPGLGVLYPGQLRRAEALDMAAIWTLLVYRSSSEVLARAVGEGLLATAGPDAALLVRDPLDLPIVGRILPWAVPTVRHFARSDHVAFWRHGIPAIQLTDTADLRNPRYHTGLDLPDTIDYQRVADTVVACAFAISRLAGVSE